jgi:hypothetical protein
LRIEPNWLHSDGMAGPRSKDADRQSEWLDVHLLDVLAQIEALLRNGREVQRESLRFRGVPSTVTPAERRKAAARITQLAARMLADSRALSGVLRDLSAGAKKLDRLAKQSPRGHDGTRQAGQLSWKG